jgi:hypothetical protein
LSLAITAAEGDIAKLRRSNWTAWYRDTLGAIAKAHRVYAEAVQAVAESREALADEVALAGWLRSGSSASPLVDGLGGSDLSFARVLQALHEDAEQTASHLREPEPRLPWKRISERVEALVGTGLTREEALKQADWGGE